MKAKKAIKTALLWAIFTATLIFFVHLLGDIHLDRQTAVQSIPVSEAYKATPVG